MGGKVKKKQKVTWRVSLGDYLTRARDGKQFKVVELGSWRGVGSNRTPLYEGRQHQLVADDGERMEFATIAMLRRVFPLKRPDLPNDDDLLPEYFI